MSTAAYSTIGTEQILIPDQGINHVLIKHDKNSIGKIYFKTRTAQEEHYAAFSVRWG